MKTKYLIEFLGWYGLVVILVAYACVSFGILESTSLWYQFLNLTGAIGIAIISYAKRAYQPMWLNAVWAVIALTALITLFVHI